MYPPKEKKTTKNVKAPGKAKIITAKNVKGKKISIKIKKISGVKGYQTKYGTNTYKLNGKKKVYGKWSAVKK